MESEYKYDGLRRRFSYDEILGYIQKDPDVIKYPNRKAYNAWYSPFHADLLDGASANIAIAKKKEIDYAGFAPYDDHHGADNLGFYTPRGGDDEMEIIRNRLVDDEMILPTNVVEPDIAGTADPMSSGLAKEGFNVPEVLGPPPLSLADRAAEAAGVVVGTAGRLGVRAVTDVAFPLFRGATDQLLDRISAPGPEAQMSLTNALAEEGIPYTAGAVATQAALQGGRMLLGGARMIGNAVYQNTERSRDQEDMARDTALYARGWGPRPFTDILTLNGMNPGHEPFDRRGRVTEAYYIGDEDPMDQRGAMPYDDDAPLRLPGSVLNTFVSDRLTPPMPAEAPAYGDLAARGRRSSRPITLPRPTGRNVGRRVRDIEDTIRSTTPAGPRQHRPAGRHMT